MIDIITSYRFRSLQELLNDWKPNRKTGSAKMGTGVMNAQLKPFTGSLHPFNIITEEIYND